VPDKVKDYIAAPKPNGYRSIHTTVFGPEEKIVEIQIRTQEMHEEAEFGVASHLHYTEQKSSGKSSEELDEGKVFASSKQTDFLKQIKSWQDSVENYDEYLESRLFRLGGRIRG
jgi:GTP pyrophosphokinase